jgi:integrase
MGQDPKTGKRKQQWIAIHGNKKEAERQLNEMLNQLEHGTFVKPGKITIKEHLTQWLDSYVVVNLSPRTAELYRYIAAKHIIPALGQTMLTKLQPNAVQRLYADKMKAGLSARTVQIIHGVLHKTLENAIKTGLLSWNPLTAVDYPKTQHREMKTMSETDIHLLLDYSKNSQYYALFYTLIFTGMRRSEALSLKWQDVDLILLKISVNKTMQYIDSAAPGKKIVFKEPKTAKSRRYISITPSNAIILREFYQAEQKKRQALGLPRLTGDSLVFCHYDGSPYLPNSITHAWIKLTRCCGLPGIRLHDCRHTYATLLLKQNVHPSVVASQLGHANVTTTLNVYSHVTGGLQNQAAQKFDDIVIGKSNTSDLDVSKMLA